MHELTSRRSFLKNASLGAAALGLASTATGPTSRRFRGLKRRRPDKKAAGQWKPVSDRKIRMGIVGYGRCKFGPQFSLQNHPNVELVAVSDLFPDRCQELARVCKCEKTYPSPRRDGEG